MNEENEYYVPAEIPQEFCFSEKSTFREYADMWLIENSNELAAKTADRYKSLLERVNMGIGHIQLKELQPYHLRQFLKKLSQYGANKRTGKCLSEKTILHHYRLISVILQQAVRDGLIPFNIASKEHMKAPKVTRHEVKSLQMSDFQNLISVLTSDVDDTNIRAKTAILLMLLTGLRRGELAGLQFGDCDLQNNTLSIRRSVLYTPSKGTYQKEPKTAKSYRTFAVSQWVVDIFNTYKCWYQTRYAVRSDMLSECKLFCQSDGSLIHPDTITIWCRKFSEQNPYIQSFTPHVLRHTYASMLMSLGISVKEISCRLGHSKLTTTCDIYTHSMQSADYAAATALDQYRI